MREKVLLLGIHRKPGYLYYVASDGVYRTCVHGPRSQRGTSSRVKAAYIEREPGYFYFVDRQGDVSRVWIGKRDAEPRSHYNPYSSYFF